MSELFENFDIDEFREEQCDVFCGKDDFCSIEFIPCKELGCENDPDCLSAGEVLAIVFGSFCIIGAIPLA